MSHIAKSSGVVIAAAAAALFTAGATVSLTGTGTAVAADGVKCVGANSCKGHSECKSAMNECKGLNSCKGHGWITTGTAADCTKAGGTVQGS